MIIDKAQGDACYYYDADATHPDPEHPQDYVEERNAKTKCKVFREKDTRLEYSGFGRMYDPDVGALGDPAEREIDLGVTTIHDSTSTVYKQVMQRELEEGGFCNVLLQEDTEPMGCNRVYAFEASKPL